MILKTSKTDATSHGKSEIIRENERLRIELSTLRESRLASNVSSVIRDAIKWPTIGYFAWRCVDSLAGKATVVDAAIDVGASLSDAIAELAPHWAIQGGALLVTVIVLTSNFRLRRANKNLLRRLSSVVPKYEALLDPGRSTSGLGPDGQTHQRDES